jgi:DNA-binding CsgD family transcriptional regulator
MSAVAAMVGATDTSFLPNLLRALDAVADATEPTWLVLAATAATGIGDPRDQQLRRRAEQIARDSAALGTLTNLLVSTSFADVLNARISDASLHATEGLRLAIESGFTNLACFQRAILGWVAAIRGDERACLELVDEAAGVAATRGLPLQLAIARWASGLLHLGLGRWELAATHLEAVSGAAPTIRHPLFVRILPDLVEAAVRADRRDVAESAADRLSALRLDGGPPWVAALAARARALLASEPDATEKLLMEALRFHARDRRPFSEARTQLLLGEHLRRERRRKEARAPLQAAQHVFEQLGAKPWAERANRELRATGQTARARDESSSTGLTIQERQVADIVAGGATNREAASQLFLSPRTVEYHLRNVFMKLGISSRTELMRLRLGESPAPTA